MGIHLSWTSCRVVELAAAENKTSDGSMSSAFGYMADSDYDRLGETDEMKRQSQRPMKRTDRILGRTGLKSWKVVE